LSLIGTIFQIWYITGYNIDLSGGNTKIDGVK